MDLEPLKIDRSRATPQRRRRSGGLPRSAALVLLLLAGGALYLFKRPAEQALDRLRLPVVQVATVIEAHPAEVGAVSGLAANGYVVAARRAALSADTPGRVVELLVREGVRVSEGQVVARIYAREYAAELQRTGAEVRRARAGVARAEAALAAARAEVARQDAAQRAAADAVAMDRSGLDLAKKEHERALRLRERDVSTPELVDRAVAELQRAGAALRRSQSLLASAEQGTTWARRQVEVAEADAKMGGEAVAVALAAEEHARALLEKTEVRAPFAGVVVLKDAEVGEVVSPNSQGGSSARGSVVTLVDFASLEVQVDLPETSLAGVRQGDPARVFLDAWPDRAYRGRVDRIWPTANRQKATVEVRVTFLERDERLRPEMGVRVVFAAEEPGQPDAARAAGEAKAARPTLLVPEEALVKVGGAEGVFVLERDVVSFRALGLGKRKGGRAVVEQGLSGGEVVVLSPPATLASGDRVRREERTP